MIAEITGRTGHAFRVDLNQPIDISLPLTAGSTLGAWYVSPLRIEPVRGDGFVGEVKQGGSVNFRDIWFNPHGHGTHTECLGHITHEDYSINQELKTFFFEAQVISLEPEVQEDDYVMTLEQVQHAVGDSHPQALIIRTLPNEADKEHKPYSNTNPPYLDSKAVRWMRELGVEHLLIDLPSVDREVDGGALLSHREFWHLPENPRKHATITEFIYVPNDVPDGHYLLNLQVAPFENDASPSRPVIYKILE